MAVHLSLALEQVGVLTESLETLMDFDLPEGKTENEEDSDQVSISDRRKIYELLPRPHLKYVHGSVYEMATVN